MLMWGCVISCVSIFSEFKQIFKLSGKESLKAGCFILPLIFSIFFGKALGKNGTLGGFIQGWLVSWGGMSPRGVSVGGLTN